MKKGWLRGGLGLAVLLPLLILAGAQGLPWGPVDERRKAGANDRKRGSED
jgi:hypothetical protein